MKRLMGILLALLMLPGGGLAEAAEHTELFWDYLTSYGIDAENEVQVSGTLRESVAPVDASLVADDVRLSITGAIFDGRFFAVGWLVENLRPENPAMVLCKTVEVNGQPVYALADFPWTSWSPGFTGLGIETEGRNRISFGMSGELSDMEAEAELTVRVTFAVKRPKGELVVVDPLVYDDASLEEGMRADWQAMLEALRASGVRIAEADALDPDAWAAQGYTVLNAGGQYYLDGEYWSEYDLSDISALHNIYYEGPVEESMETVEDVVIEFPMDAGECLSRVRDVTPREDIIEDDRAIRFTHVRLSPLTTFVEYEVIPAEETEEALAILTTGSAWPVMTDQDGKALAFSGAGTVINHNGSDMRQRDDGTYYRETSRVWPGLMELPSGIRMTISGTSVFIPVPQ